MPWQVNRQDCRTLDKRSSALIDGNDDNCGKDIRAVFSVLPPADYRLPYTYHVL